MHNGCKTPMNEIQAVVDGPISIEQAVITSIKQNFLSQ